MRAGRTITACCCRFQRRSAGGLTTNANYTISTCEGLISQGQAPLNVATGYMKPVSLINPPSDAERDAIFEEDKGRCGTWRKHILNLSASIETPQFSNATARALGSGWRLSGIYRVNSGSPLTVFTGTDRALSGIQTTTQRADQVLDNPYGDKTINNWLNPRRSRSRRWAPTETRYAMPTTVRDARSSTSRWCGRSGLATVTASRRASRRSTRSTGSCWRTRTRRCRLRPSGALPRRAIRASCSLR